MSLYIGLDPSLDGTGVSIIDHEYMIDSLYKLHTKAKDVNRLIQLELEFKEIIDKYRTDLVLCCFESPSYNSEGRLVEIGEWYGVFKLILFKAGIPCISVAPLQLKQYCTGEGKNFTKSVIMLHTFKNFGVEFDDDNKCDAYILSRIAHDYYHTYVLKSKLDLKEYHKKVLEKIHKAQEIKIKKKLL